MMKKIISILSVLFLCIILSACGKASVKSVKIEENLETTQLITSDITIEQLREANQFSKVFATNSLIQCQTYIFETDYTINASTNTKKIWFQDGQYESQYEDSNGDMKFQMQNQLFNYNSNKKLTTSFFMEGQLNKKFDSIEEKVFYFKYNETIENIIFKDNETVTVITEAFVGRLPQEIKDLVDMSIYNKVQFNYTCNADTLEVSNCSVTAIFRPDKKISNRIVSIMNIRYTYSNENIKRPDFVPNLEDNTPTRNIKLHLENGEVLNYTIAKESAFNVYAEEGYALYMDSTASETMESKDIGEDMDVYLIKK